VADPNAARRGRGAVEGTPAPARKRAPAAAAAARPGRAGGALDHLIHHRMRLGIVSALAAAETLTFNELKAVLGATDGNLSVHARKLEEAGYVTCTKGFDGRRPRTEYRLSPAGRRELGRYVNHMEAIIRVTRGTLGR
jgi:DNA-binding transcriptional ArsR family regulator